MRLSKARQAYEDTSVPWHRSRGEVEELIRKHTKHRGISWAEVREHELAPRGGSLVLLRFITEQDLPDGSKGLVGVRIGLPIPAAQTEKERQQKTNQRHRALFHWLKAKFVAVEAGLVTFPEEFFAHIETGQHTVFEQVAPQLIQGLLEGQVRPLALLPHGV